MAAGSPVWISRRLAKVAERAGLSAPRAAWLAQYATGANCKDHAPHEWDQLIDELWSKSGCCVNCIDAARAAVKLSISELRDFLSLSSCCERVPGSACETGRPCDVNRSQCLAVVALLCGSSAACTALVSSVLSDHFGSGVPTAQDNEMSRTHCLRFARDIVHLACLLSNLDVVSSVLGLVQSLRGGDTFMKDGHLVNACAGGCEATVQLVADTLQAQDAAAADGMRGGVFPYRRGAGSPTRRADAEAPKTQAELGHALTAACHSSIHVLQYLLSLQGRLQVSTIPPSAQAALPAAAANPDIRVLQTILALDSQIPFPSQTSVLQGFYAACKSASVAHVKAFLALGGSRRIRSSRDFFTGFASACESGNVDVVRFMLTLRGDQRVPIGSQQGMVLAACGRKADDETALLLLQLLLGEDTALNFPLQPAGLNCMRVCIAWNNFRSLAFLLEPRSHWGCDLPYAVRTLSHFVKAGTLQSLTHACGPSSVLFIISKLHISVAAEHSGNVEQISMLALCTSPQNEAQNLSDETREILLWMLQHLYAASSQRGGSLAQQLRLSVGAGRGWCQHGATSSCSRAAASAESADAKAGFDWEIGASAYHQPCLTPGEAEGLFNSGLCSPAVHRAVHWRGITTAPHAYYGTASSETVQLCLSRRTMVLNRVQRRKGALKT